MNDEQPQAPGELTPDPEDLAAEREGVARAVADLRKAADDLESGKLVGLAWQSAGADGFTSRVRVTTGYRSPVAFQINRHRTNAMGFVHLVLEAIDGHRDAVREFLFTQDGTPSDGILNSRLLGVTLTTLAFILPDRKAVFDHLVGLGVPRILAEDFATNAVAHREAQVALWNREVKGRAEA